MIGYAQRGFYVFFKIVYDSLSLSDSSTDKFDCKILIIFSIILENRSDIY